MAKIRIHELAKELDKQSKEIQSFLQGKGIEAKSASSSVEEDVAETVRKAFGKGGGKSEKAAPGEAAAGVKPSQGSPSQGNAPQGNAPQGNPSQGNALQGSPSQGNASQGSPSQGNAPQGNASQGSPSREKPAQEKPGQGKAAQGREASAEAPKKRKTIIFVNNSQNSQNPKAPGQRYGQGGGSGRPQGQNSGHGERRKQSAVPPRTPIKPLTPPSPTPSVQMVPSRPPVAKAKPDAGKQEIKAASAPKPAVQTEIVQVQSKENRPERSERRQEDRPGRFGRGQENRGQENRGQDSRGSENRGQENRYQGNRDNRGQGAPRGERPERGQFQPRGGNGNGGPREERGSGYPRTGRPGGQGGQGGSRGPGFGQGGNRGYNGAQRDNGGYGRGNGGQGAGFRDRGQNKGFAGEAPAKDMEKRREDEKRRASNIEKDKRSKRDHIYEEEEALKNRPGRFIKPEKKKDEAAEEQIKVITLPDTITIKELAEKMKLQPAAIVKKLFLEGKVVTVNQEVSYEDAENIAMEYDILCEREVKVDVIEELLKEDEEEEGTLVERPPVVCVMGHVDLNLYKY